MENFENLAGMMPPEVPPEMPPEGMMPPEMPPEMPQGLDPRQMMEDLEAQSTGRKSKVIAIVIGLIVIAIVAGLGIWYWAGRNDQTTETAQSTEMESGKKPNATDTDKVDYPANPDAEAKEDEGEAKDEQASGATEDEPAGTQPEQPEEPTNDEPKKVIVTVNFEANGAQIGAEKVTCEKTGTGCKVKLPTITREGWEILGWGEAANATAARYKSGEEITVGANRTFYAITKKTNTITFEKNGAEGIGATVSSCTVYNKATACEIVMPEITRKGWTILGWAQDAKATAVQFKVGDRIYTSNSRTLYAITKK